MENESPIVFIHYSWDNESHKKWTLFLADRLIADGIEVIFDRYDLKLGSNNNYFMEKIETADKVLLIMTPDYKIKADNRTSGIGYEYQIISSEFSQCRCSFLSGHGLLVCGRRLISFCAIPTELIEKI